MKTILVFFIIFSIIVVFHEFGHYYFAKKAGIRVREFALGMGPKLFAKQDKSGTTYTIRMLPLGGYVRLSGLNEEDGIEPGMSVGLQFDHQDQVIGINLSEKLTTDELPALVDAVELIDEMTISVQPIGNEELITYPVSRNAFITEADGTRVLVSPRDTRYESVSPWAKIKTNFAGPLNNFILAIVTFMIVGFITGVPSDSARIGRVIEDSNALKAGLMDGDKVLSVDNIAVLNWEELITQIHERPDQEVVFKVERDGEEVELPVKIASVTVGEVKSGRIGIERAMENGFLPKILYGFTETFAVMTLVITTILNMFKTGFDVNQFGGPVAMAQMTSQVVEHGFVTVLGYMAMLSANLGVMNLLPIPALDGGKIILNIYEAVRGKPLAQEKEGIITLIGVGLLVLLMLVVTWNDIMRLFN